MDDDLEKIVEISDAAWTPEFTIRKALDFVDAIDDIAIVFLLKDGTLDTMSSMTTPGTFALLAKKLELRLEEFLVGDEDEI